MKEKQLKAEEKDDMFKLPSIDEKFKIALKEEEEEPLLCPKKNYNVNINKIDVNSSHFKSLPADIRHDILIDIKETRKQNSWAKLRELPIESKDFSSYQMGRLLKRRQVQVSLEGAEKEMGGKVWSISELESLLTEDGVIDVSEKHAQKLASDENTRFVLVRDIAKAIKAINDAKEAAKIEPSQPSTSKIITEENFGEEYDLELQRAIQMSLQNEENTDDEFEEVEEINDKDPIKLNEEQRKKFSATVQPHGLVRGFMMEYAGMNDDDISDMANTTQKPENEDKLNDSFGKKFPNTDAYVLYGSQQKSKSPTIELSDEEESLQKVNTEIVITVDKSKYKEDEDIFADIFSSTNPLPLHRASSPDIEIASISSSDDDTIDYEIPADILSKSKELAANAKEIETSFVSEDVELPSQEINNEEKAAATEIILNQHEEGKNENVCSVNENFWKNLENSFTEEEKKEVESIKDLSENEKFWLSDTEDDKNQEKNVSNEEIKSSPQKPAMTKEEVSKAVDELRKDNTDLELKKMKEELHQQQADFELERNKLNRQGMSITQQMSNDCKELLKLFGIPFMQAPMEAEAQCAFLNAVKITDGTITDDSDVWLFGAQTVYKNFFVQKKIVQEFRMENLDKMLHLDRKKLIQLAMLVGSDYTVGITGIGSVTALEILAAFPTTPEDEGSTDQYQSMLSSLRKFRDWFQSGKQPGVGGKTVLRGKLKNIELIEGFPSVNVLRAYMEPMIDSNEEPFSWGQLDVESIMELTKTKLGWTRLKTEEIIGPVIKRLNEKKQSTIRDYFKTQLQTKVFDTQKLSKRVQKAVGRMGGENNNDDEEEEKPKKQSRKRPVAKSKKNKADEVPTVTLSESDDDDEPPVKKSPGESKMQVCDKPKEKNSKASASRKRKVKNSDEPSTSSASVDNSDETLLFKKKPAPRIPETKQVIPQRERDKKELEANKQKAIEVFKNAKKPAKKK